ncbi:MAG: hypothetical protein LAT55_13840 [Opitutales bacterium]|nr:hypothetical protein [Opitutales bacterium]
MIGVVMIDIVYCEGHHLDRSGCSLAIAVKALDRVKLGRCDAVTLEN